MSVFTWNLANMSSLPAADGTVEQTTITEAENQSIQVDGDTDAAAKIRKCKYLFLY